ncbi:unnamed protein product, partial [Gulo gulo]
GRPGQGSQATGFQQPTRQGRATSGSPPSFPASTPRRVNPKVCWADSPGKLGLGPRSHFGRREVRRTPQGASLGLSPGHGT